VPTVRLHPDGKWVTAFLQDGTLHTWEVATGKAVHMIDGLNYHVWQTMVLGPRGRSALPCNDMSPLLYSLRPADAPKAFAPELWDRLGGDANAAYRAQWALLDHPDEALDLLERQLPVETTARQRAWFDARAGKLGDPQFRTREAAARELREAIAELPLEWLDAAIKGSKSAEARERLEKLQQDREAALAPNRLRIERAVQVVEQIDTPRARKLLEAWSKGARPVEPEGQRGRRARPSEVARPRGSDYRSRPAKYSFQLIGRTDDRIARRSRSWFFASAVNSLTTSAMVSSSSARPTTSIASPAPTSPSAEPQRAPAIRRTRAGATRPRRAGRRPRCRRGSG
jgi:hypothetical protein